jgi:hypothetical protein
MGLKSAMSILGSPLTALMCCLAAPLQKDLIGMAAPETYRYLRRC